MLAAFIAIAVYVPTPRALASGEIDWSSTSPESGTQVGSEVEIVGPGTFRIVTVDAPGIDVDHYEVSGMVRYSGVEDVAYLEMWSFFADGEAYFSRTLAAEGPLASMSGDSDGREFVLPFSLNGAAGPIRVEINVVLPAAGTVWVGPLTLEGFQGSTPWWSERTAAIVGASLGIAVGLAGAAIGWLNTRRKAQRAVTRLVVGGFAVGVVSLAAAGVAGLTSQPRHVWYPLVLVGVILAGVSGMQMRSTRQAQSAAELRRMRAMDAR
jgi:hypothetical protein